MMWRFHIQRAVAEFERAFIPGATSGYVAARKQPAWPSNQKLLNLFATGAHSSKVVFVAGFRSRQFAPARSNFRRRITQHRFIHHLPDVLRKTRGNAFAGGQRWQRNIGLTERVAMFVLPRDEKSLAILFESERTAAFTRNGADTVCRINVLDPRNRRKFKAGLAGDRKSVV